MRAPGKHELIIGTRASLAGCTCRTWPAPARFKGEPLGVYTLRAYGAHLAHKERASEQSVQQTIMFEPQQGLFARAEE